MSATRKHLGPGSLFRSTEVMTESSENGRGPAIKRLIDAYHSGLKRYKGITPIRPGYGRFAKELQGILPADEDACRALEAELLILLDDFFTATDPKILRTDFRPIDFLNVLQHLRLRRAGRRPFNDRTAANVDAAVRATEPR